MSNMTIALLIKSSISLALLIIFAIDFIKKLNKALKGYGLHSPMVISGVTLVPKTKASKLERQNIWASLVISLICMVIIIYWGFIS